MLNISESQPHSPNHCHFISLFPLTEQICAVIKSLNVSLLDLPSKSSFEALWDYEEDVGQMFQTVRALIVKSLAQNEAALLAAMFPSLKALCILQDSANCLNEVRFVTLC